MSSCLIDIEYLKTTQGRLAAAKFLAGNAGPVQCPCSVDLSDEALLAQNNPSVTEWVFRRRQMREKAERENARYAPTDVHVYNKGGLCGCN